MTAKTRSRLTSLVAAAIIWVVLVFVLPHDTPTWVMATIGVLVGLFSGVGVPLILGALERSREPHA